MGFLNRLRRAHPDPTISRRLAIHQLLYQSSRGLMGVTLGGHPTLLLHTIGRRSAKRRTSALMYFQDSENLVIIASNGGSDDPPAWLLNLQANPSAVVRIGRTRQPVMARLADEPDHARLWSLANEEMHGQYDLYQARSDRKIPVVVLSRA